MPDATAVSVGGDRSVISDRLSPGLIVRLRYASFLFMGLLTCLVLRSAMGSTIKAIPYLREGCEFIGQHAVDAAHLCYGNTFVYRVSFALALFFGFHFLSVSDLTCCVDDESRASFQTEFFCAKAVFLALLQVLTFWLPNAFFATYAWVCLFASAIFLVVQIMLIVDFSYMWSEEWAERSEDNSKWVWYLVIVAVATMAFGAAATVYSFVVFVPHSDCNLHGFLLTGNALAAVVYTGLAVWVPHGSVVPSGIIFAYTSFVMFTALRVSPDQRCNALAIGAGQEGFFHPSSIGITIASAFVTAGALAYTTVSISGSDSQTAMSLATDDADDDDTAARRGWGSATGHLPGYCYFHLIMLMGSMYLAMLGTDWQVSGNAATDSAASSTTAGDTAAFWVKLATQWITIAVYLWSLLAPYFCCSDRDFGYDADW